MPSPLTTRQRTVLDVIRAWIRDHGYPPTIRELGRALRIKSLRGVTTHLDAIARKGFLTRGSGARTLRLHDALDPMVHVVRVPIVGRIHAGTPVLAEENLEGHLAVDQSWLRRKASSAVGQHFALKVRGESMVEAGIFDDDYVIVRQQATANSGDIVVARLDGETTVKQFQRQGRQVRLKAAHPTMAPITASDGQELEILGKVVAVFRALP